MEAKSRPGAGGWENTEKWKESRAGEEERWGIEEALGTSERAVLLQPLPPRDSGGEGWKQ